MSAISLPRIKSQDKPAKQYPPPTAKITRHPLRAVKNLIVKLGLSLGGTHLALLAWVAVYYILFETIHPVKAYWDTLFSQHIHLLSQTNWDSWRHFLRNGGEAYLATLAVLFFTFNPFTHPKTKPIRTSGQILGRVGLATLGMLVVAVPIGLLLHGMQQWFHTGILSPAISTHPNFAEKLYSDQWTTKLSVVLAALATRRLMYPVYTFTMEYFAERRVARGKKDRWYQPAPFRAMVRLHYKSSATQRSEFQYRSAVDRAQRLQAQRGQSVVWLMRGGLVLALALAAFGYYVLEYIA